MSKEVIKQFSGTVYKFVFCNYTSPEKNEYCGKIHIYERRITNLEPPEARFFYIGDLEDNTEEAYARERESNEKRDHKSTN